jgi:predicted CxxxxCH...CXXCH cytochrome family protein
LCANRDTDTYSNSYCHSDANSDTDSYGDDNSKPEPDCDGHVYTNGGTEIYTNT